ncbi:MAG: transglutaminase-like cysteine peptidase [Desulfovibrio sp.]|jgi:predicted transglutaminase-like cysteine proteinase|nr:transglutaminase-like cysteine peptidase [Desulfovibrio sp.]
MGASISAEGDKIQTRLWRNFAPRWERILRQEQERPVFTSGGQADLPPKYRRLWENMLVTFRGKDEMFKARAVCGFMNTQFHSASDMELYKRPDHWAAPAEMIEKGAGDSEDFAFIKYFALRSLGFKADDIRLLVVDLPGEAETRDVLLAVRIKDKMYIQDFSFRPADLLLPVSDAMAKLYKPVAAFNEEGVWYYR